jgi:hypothetical protein
MDAQMMQMVMSSVLDVSAIAVFVPTTAAIWVLHAGSPERLRLTVAGVVIVLIPTAAITIRVATGEPLPVWFLLPYLLMMVLLGYVIFTNMAVLIRNRERIIEIRRHQ